MSQNRNQNQSVPGEATQTKREAFASAFDLATDPLKQYSDAFYGLPDPFELYIEEVLLNKENVDSESTIEEYPRTYRQWRQHMETMGRHPACPNPEHVSKFIKWRREVHNNKRRTIRSKLNRLERAYTYWQDESIFPHPSDYNPFQLGRKRTHLGDDGHKGFHDLALDDLQSTFAGAENLRTRGIIGTQLKLGLRRGEICNLQLQDIHISLPELQDRYAELGSHPALDGITDALYIATDRKGNKSANPRLLPLDEELRWMLLRYLLTRPQVDEPWVFLSKTSYSQLSGSYVNAHWKDVFHPQFGETEQHRSITSHFGRHWFSSYWRLTVGLEREHVQYMRGDLIQPMDEFPSAIDDYLHPNYHHIEQIYCNKTFKLDIPMRHHVPKRDVTSSSDLG